MLALHARYVFPVTSPPLQNAVVTVEHGRIAHVGNAPPTAELVDLGNVALLPGLVNAHTHLEFSQLTSPIGCPGSGMAQWIRHVIAYRRQSGNMSADAAIRAGLAECLAQGVTTVGEIAQPGWPANVVAESPVNTTVFLELLAPVSQRVGTAIEHAHNHVHAASQSVAWRAGLSPHTPYTVHPSLLEAAVSLSAQHAIPLAFHLAESADEMELFTSGGGPLRILLEDLGAWQPGLIASNSRPLDYLSRLAAAHRTLIIHGNYLDAEELALLARHRQRMAVVYCPRTHAWFGHRPYPLHEMLDAGVCVALGTDSRASSPDLSLLAEIRHVAHTHPQVTRDVVLRLGTLHAAEALGLDQQIGSLEPGKWADLTAVRLPDHDAADPHELLFDAQTPVVGVWCKGIQKPVTPHKDTE
jgi:cytosine/adenosine deaminase-related metal-dependent hydrolase